MEIYSVAEIAQNLGLHVATIKRYINDGKLKATKKGQMWLVTSRDLEVLTSSEWFKIERSINTGRPKKSSQKSKAKSKNSPKVPIN